MLRSIEHFPNNAEFHCNLGEIYRKQNNYRQAINSLNKALAINPEMINAYLNLAMVYETIKKPNDAINCCIKCLQYQPDNSSALYHINLLYQSIGRYDDAIAYCQRIIQHNIRDVKAWNDMGVAYHKKGQYLIAEQCFEKSLDINAKSPLAHENRAVLWLLQGKYKEGFLEYQWFRKDQFHPALTLSAAISGKRILIHSERGFGDTIQFCRYLLLLKEQNATVLFKIPDPLFRLFSSSNLADQYFITNQNDIGPYDYSAGVLFLPCYFKTTHESIPAQTPYLQEPETVKDAISATIHQNKKQFNIGIVWAGNSQNENDIHRSMPLSFFETISSLPGICLFSFQKDQIQRDEINKYQENMSVIDLGAHFDDFADTASAISEMDLMICVETSVAHLSGALGHPTWLLLSTVPDWRWLLDCQTSPWYPGMQIFRQNQEGNWSQVMTNLKKALLPFMVKKLYHYANSRMKQKQFKQACQYFETITQIDPNAFTAWLNMGNAYGLQSQLKQCIQCYEKASSIKPNHPVCLYNLGRAWYIQRNYQQAIACFQKAIDINPDYFKAIYNLGSTYYRTRDIDKSIDAFQKALSLKPNSIDIFTNIGSCYGKKGELDTAIEWHQKSVDASPNYADGHYNMGISLLLDGHLKEGFQKYEWRLQRSDFPKPAYEQPLWDGSTFKNKTLLTYMEQGFGDAIQFVRYLPQVKARGGIVLLVCHPLVQRLFQTAQGVDKVIPENHPLPSFDYHISLMSLPAIFQTDIETIPSETPYLSIPLNNPDSLDNIIEKKGKQFNIGFVWAGNPSNKHDQDRSIPLHMFSPIASIDGIQMFSLQKDQQAETSQMFDFVDLAPYITDFSDTAYAISKLDLIISVDTAVAHLAGATHCPVWILLPKVPDWRWLLNRDDSPWYPTARLFRQKDHDRWTDVFLALIHQLKIHMNHPQMHDIPKNLSSDYVADQLLKQGNYHFSNGQMPAAILKYQECLSMKPDNSEVLFNLGVSYLQNEDVHKAIEYLKHAIDIDPEYHDAYNNLGIAYQRLGNKEKAIESFEAAIQYQPESARSLYNLGNACKHSQQFQKAEKYYKQAIAIQPDFAECMNNLADAYIYLERYDDAMKMVDQALTLCSDYPEFYFNKGVIFSRLGDYASGIQYLRKAIDMNPEFIDAHYSLCFCLLVLGHLREGFRQHEWRIAKHPNQHQYGLQRWKGEPFDGKRLLVYLEQGFGDCIQFARYLPKIKKGTGNVILGCNPELYTLFLHLDGVDEVIKEGDQCQACDLQVSIVSLPFLCKTTIDTIPSETPYLRVHETSHERIDSIIAPYKDRFCIGIVWAGRPDHKSDAERSVSYEIFRPLNSLHGVQIFSFQKKDGLSEVFETMNWIDLGSYFNDFSDTAYAAQKMDLIITVDTSMAHLAGALALPVWVLIPPIPDWRWLLDREDSPWYPKMRLFRRQKNEEWQDVVVRILYALREENTVKNA
ncbi:MAG: TPR repeat-containing protein [Candidatus Magnetoglobus multicellularis str. Araruama]|uniref:TPR repeat-containing protein n=1 Tax=Candidatus Magnetoglobus multicellularis str. Araruama TaxID=890399 RepID=A0A1V1PDA2_9BACT|nr:MAG: TPR repeat-containing protein [Candidatus Magnetoglobus multicellularis str. Araruama]